MTANWYLNAYNPLPSVHWDRKISWPTILLVHDTWSKNLSWQVASDAGPCIWSHKVNLRTLVLHTCWFYTSMFHLQTVSLDFYHVEAWSLKLDCKHNQPHRRQRNSQWAGWCWAVQNLQVVATGMYEGPGMKLWQVCVMPEFQEYRSTQQWRSPSRRTKVEKMFKVSLGAAQNYHSRIQDLGTTQSSKIIYCVN